jgi:hypothetical protein
MWWVAIGEFRSRDFRLSQELEVEDIFTFWDVSQIKHYQISSVDGIS